ncbi:MAG: T9SS type A sorting domain-containing protein [Bacteroidales bacterium]|nr:T9SS type A sorting domain-containing protein [Bacteroidales bacterium]
MRTTHKLLLLLSIWLVANAGFAQPYGQWLDAKLITDTVSDNHYPFLVHTNFTYVYWEKTAPDGTMICYRNISEENSETDTILYEAGVDFRNPRAMDVSPYAGYDAEYFLLYERWEDDEGSIHYMECDSDGPTSAPILISGDITVLHSMFSQDREGLVWMNGEEILYARLTSASGFDEPVLIVTGNFLSPVLSIDGNKCAWLSYNGSQMQLMYSFAKGRHMKNQAIVAYEADTLFNLTTEQNNGGFNYGCMVSFGTKENQNYTIKNLRLDHPDPYNIIYPEGYDKMQSSILTLDQIVKPFRPDYPGCLTTLVCDTGSGKEIFANSPESVHTTINISNYPGDDIKPRLFYGAVENVKDQSVEQLCLWETYRNGHWALAMNKIVFLITGESEIKAPSQNKLTITPNPIAQHATINYSLEHAGIVSIDMYNPDGMHMINLLNETQQPGDHALNWNKQEYQLPAGVYIITLKTAQEKISQKVVIR